MSRRMGQKRPSKAQLIKMREAGMGQVSIAKALNSTPSTIRYYLRLYNMPTVLANVYFDNKVIDAAIERWERHVLGRKLE